MMAEAPITFGVLFESTLLPDNSHGIAVQPTPISKESGTNMPADDDPAGAHDLGQNSVIR
jgi:hypothetical protein